MYPESTYDQLMPVTAACMASARWGTVLELNPAMLILLHQTNASFIKFLDKNKVDVHQECMRQRGTSMYISKG